MRLLKCYGPNCEKQGIKHPKEDLTVFKRKNYCDNCLPIVKALSDQYDHLLKFIVENYHVPYPSPQMLSQIKNFTEQRHYTYIGIETALEYMHIVRHKEFNSHFGLGYIPYVYNDAQSWRVKQTVARPVVQASSDNLPDIAVMKFTHKQPTVGLIDEEGLLD